MNQVNNATILVLYIAGEAIIAGDFVWLAIDDNGIETAYKVRNNEDIARIAVNQAMPKAAVWVLVKGSVAGDGKWWTNSL